MTCRALSFTDLYNWMYYIVFLCHIVLCVLHHSYGSGSSINERGGKQMHPQASGATEDQQDEIILWLQLIALIL